MNTGKTNSTSTAGVVTGALNAVANAAGNLAKNTGAAVQNAAQAVGNVATKAANGVVNAVNTAAKNAPAINSLIPFGTPQAANKPANGPNKPANGANANKPANQGGNNLFRANGNTNAANANQPPPTAANFSVAPAPTGAWWAWPLGIFVLLVAIFLTVFAVFNEQIQDAYEQVATYFKSALGFRPSTPVSSAVEPAAQPLTQPVAPQDVLPTQAAAEQGLVEKILPTGGGNEVFNVSQNKFTFYDAEPLCRALGAELATYDQVKEAWAKGADWCNYGWVQGQMAVYPTQKETYERLQNGPEDQRNVCGTPGLNGGSFENPELRFGVNCYGKKPSQTGHDEVKLMAQGKIPGSPEAITVDKLTNQFKSMKDGLFVRPFSDDKWNSA